MSIDRKLKRKVVDAVGELVEATKKLRDVSVEVLAETGTDDAEAKSIMELTGKITEGMLPLEIMHIQMEKKLSEE